MDSDRVKGSENLESMEIAVRYNTYLVEKVLECIPHEGNILDFGAGSGLFAMMMRDQGIEVICVEPNTDLDQLLKSRGFLNHSDLTDIKKGSITGIYTLNVLEHIENDVQVIKSLSKLLKPGGKLFIYVPAFPFLFSNMDKRVSHYRRYTRRELISKLRESNLKILQTEYVDFLGFFATLLYKMFGDQSGKVSEKNLLIYDTFIFPISKKMDKLTKRFIGKNLLLIAEKPNS